MLDLDDIAERHARNLNQDAGEWRTALWNEPFQRLTQSMTDGEIREFISLCDSCSRLDRAVSVVVAAGDAAISSPLSYLREAAKSSGQDAVEFVRSLG